MSESILREQRVLDWVGTFPERWEIHSLGSQMYPVAHKNIGLKVKTVLSLSYGRVIVKPIEKLRGLVPESFETYQILEPGDIVIRPTDLQNDKTSLRVGFVQNHGIITSAYISIRTRDSLDKRYASLLLGAYDFMKVFYGFGSGLRQNLDFRHLKHIPIPLPPKSEQELIVRYLDHAELRIAKAIQAKQKMVALLNEQKQVIISELVTRGLNPDVPMKDSGQAWLGQIPAHWDVVPVRATLQRNKRVVGSRKDEFQLLSLTKQGVIVRDLVGMKGKFPASFDSYQEVNSGDFIFCMFDVDETPRAVGRSNYRGMITGAYDVFTPTDYMDSSYLLQQFLTFDNHKLLKPLYRGLRKTIPMPWFLGMKIACPPTSEQVLIADSIVVRTESIDRTLDVLGREIELLKEYRKVLISDVVTGRRDVRAEAASLPDVDPAELAQVLSGAVSVVGEEDEVDGASEAE